MGRGGKAKGKGDGKDGKGEGEKKEEEEEEELFIGDTVRISSNMQEVKKALEKFNMSWEASMAALLGKIAVIKGVRFANDTENKPRQLCQLSVKEGPEAELPGSALSVMEDEDSDKESVDKGSDEEEEDEDEDRVAVPIQLNMRVEDVKRKKKKKVHVGIVTAIFEDEGNGEEANIKYEDGRSKRVALDRLRPFEKVTKDATGFSGDSRFNDFRFTKNCIPTGATDAPSQAWAQTCGSARGVRGVVRAPVPSSFDREGSSQRNVGLSILGRRASARALRVKLEH